MRRCLRIGSLLASALCMIVFLSVRQESPEAGGAVERQTVGLPFSPWAEYVSRREVIRDERGNTTSRASESGRVLWASWSWLLLAGCVAGIVAFRRLRPAPAIAPATEGDAAW